MTRVMLLGLVVCVLVGGCASALAVDLPQWLIGTWLTMWFNNQGALIGGDLFSIAENGQVSTELALGEPVVGQCTRDGTLTGNSVSGETTTRTAGDLDPTGTGTGSWAAMRGGEVVGSGDAEALRQDGGIHAGTYDLEITGADAGTGTVEIDADGGATGDLTTASLGKVDFFGIATSAGDFVGLYRKGDETVASLQGGIAGGAASGNWYNIGDDSTGPFTATRQ